ncbi:PDZ domain-containing protein [bacterium]|nr:MAG: PDZ domain-containing protein [bacterium]
MKKIPILVMYLFLTMSLQANTPSVVAAKKIVHKKVEQQQKKVPILARKAVSGKKNTVQAGSTKKPALAVQEHAGSKKPSTRVGAKTKKLTKSTKKDPKNNERDIYKWFQTYSQVVSLIEDKSFRLVDFEKFIQDSLKSAVAQVDAHSAFFGPKSYKDAKESTSGEFPGIGVSVITKAPDDDALSIVDVVQGGPAHKAGLQSGDKIVEVDGEKLKGLSSDEVIAKLKGKVKTKVKIKIIRKKKPREYIVTRDIIKDQTSLSYFFKELDIYYVSLSIFNEVAATQVKQLLEKANKGGCKGIVLDLRRNPGGTLDSAIDMAGLFLPKNSPVVLTKDNKGTIITEYKTHTDPILHSSVPIFILIDNFAASAAEILAGCLRYHAQKDENSKLMVFLVGIPTFGKGSVQELIPIKNGCALKLTTMLYYLPDEHSLQAIGIKPDFIVKPKIVPVKEMKWVKEFFGKESSLKHHITVQEVKDIGGKKEAANKKSGKSVEKKKSFWRRLFGAAGKQEEELAQAEREEDDGLFDDDEDDDEDDELVIEKDGKKKEYNKKSWEEKQQKSLGADIQVQACVNMINILTLAREARPVQVDTRKKALSFLKKHYLTDNPVEVEKVK